MKVARHREGLVAPAGKPALLAQALDGIADGAAAAFEAVEQRRPPRTASSLTANTAGKPRSRSASPCATQPSRQARNHETAKAADIAPPAVADTVEEAHENVMRGTIATWRDLSVTAPSWPTRRTGCGVWPAAGRRFAAACRARHCRRRARPDSCEGPANSRATMAQNIYDNEAFFAGYSRLPRSIEGLDGAPEWPALRALLPELRRPQRAGSRLRLRMVLPLGTGARRGERSWRRYFRPYARARESRNP